MPVTGIRWRCGVGLKVMGPPSLLSGLPSTAGSEAGSMDWGREYEDEDTWYEVTTTSISTSYQTGPDTHLLPSKVT